MRGMAPCVGRRIVDRHVDLDKLRAAIGRSSKANDFHKGSPNRAPFGTGVAIRPRARLYVVEGELNTEPRDGRTFKLLPGMSYQLGFSRWIGPAGPKAAETLAKLRIPSFTRRVR